MSTTNGNSACWYSEKKGIIMIRTTMLAIVAITLTALCLIAGSPASACTGNGCVTTDIPDVVHTVRVTCKAAYSDAAMRATSDGGNIFIVKAAGPGFCVRTPQKVVAYVAKGKKVYDKTLGRNCLYFEDPKHLHARLFWEEGGVWKSKETKFIQG